MKQKCDEISRHKKQFEYFSKFRGLSIYILGLLYFDPKLNCFFFFFFFSLIIICINGKGRFFILFLFLIMKRKNFVTRKISQQHVHVENTVEKKIKKLILIYFILNILK
jgi:hypothetical protein